MITQHKRHRAITLSETLTVLSLVGIMIFVMLPLNQLFSKDYRIAQTKITQVEHWMRAWGKTLSYSNETGLGAIYVIHDQASLVESLCQYFHAKTLSNKNNIPFKDAEGTMRNNYDNIELNNGVVLKAIYLLAPEDSVLNGGVTFKKDAPNSNLALIRVDIKVKDQSISEEFYLKGSGRIKTSSQR